MAQEYNITKGLRTATVITCADNTGAKKLKIIGFLKGGSGKRRHKRGGIGDIAIVTIVKGLRTLRKKPLKALIIRQRMMYLRKTTGLRVFFKDNAAVLLKEDFSFRGTKIKGLVAKEVIKIHEHRKYNFSGVKIV